MIDELLHEHTDAQVAEILRGQNLVTGAENPFAGINIAWVRKRYELKSFKQRLVERGMIPMEELCRRFGICRDTARDWQRLGILRGQACNEKGEWMFEIPPEESLPNMQRDRTRKGQVATNAVGGAV